MKIRINVSGADRVKRTLTDIEKKSPLLAQNVNRTLGLETSRRAKQNIKPIFPKSNNSEGLKEHIFMRTGANRVFVTAKTSYAQYVETGTGPSTTGYPRSVRIGNKWVRMISHPGSSGYPSQRFFSRAMLDTLKEFDKIVKQESKKLFKDGIKF